MKSRFQFSSQKKKKAKGADLKLNKKFKSLLL